MDKNRLIKILRRKTYWEKERDVCLSQIFTFLIFFIGLSIKASSYPGIKKIKEIGWSNAGGGEKFNYVLDWFLIIIMITYLFFAIYFLIRIQTCSSKLICLNRQLLEELNKNELAEDKIRIK